MEGQEKIDLSWLPDKSQAVDLSFLPPPKRTIPRPGVGRIVSGQRRPLEIPKRPGIFPAIGEALKTTGQQIIAPVEAGVRMAAGIPAFFAGTAATVGGQAVTGDWEKGADIGRKVGGFLSGGESRLGGEYTRGVEEMLSPLMAPFSIAMEKGPEFMAPNEPRTQAMLGAGMGLLAILLPKLGVTPKTLIRDAKMKIWRDRSVPVEQRAAVMSELNKAEAAGAKTVEDIQKPKPSTARIKTTPTVSSHAGQGGFSPEAVSRGKTIEFFIFDNKTKKSTPLIGVDAVDVRPGPGQLKYQTNKLTGKTELVEVGKGATPLPVNVVKKPTVTDIRKSELKVRMDKESSDFIKSLEAVAAKIESRPKGVLNLTSEQRGMGLDEFTKQGQGLMGEPRGGGIPTGFLKKPGEQVPTMELPKRVGPINLERINLDVEPKKLMADIEDALHAKRQKDRLAGTWDVAEERARMIGGAHDIGQAIGKPVEEVLKDFGNRTEDLPAMVEASRAILVTAAQKLTDMSREYLENPTESGFARIQITKNQYAAIQYIVGGGSSNIGRALNIHKKVANAKDILLTKGMKQVLNTLGKDVLGHEEIKILAALDSSNPVGMLKFLAEHKPATTRQKLFELWMNSILSNPQTHAVNMTSNLGSFLWRAGETFVGAGFEAGQHPFNIAARDIYFGESAHYLMGALRGVSDALKLGWEQAKAGAKEGGVGGAVRGVGKAYGTIKDKLASPTKLEIPTHAIKGIKGEVARIPSKALGVEDTLAKTVIYESKIYSEAYKAATRERLKGDAKKARVKELIANPTDAMRSAAKHESLYLTFNNELGELGKAVMHLRQRVPGLEFIIPFIRTPANIAKFGVQRTILGAPSLFREAFRGELPSAELSKRGASIVTTTLASIALIKLVMDGNVTGSGPTDKRERDILYGQGWQPRSIKVGGTYIGYGRVEPFSTILGLYTDFYDIRQHATEKDANKISGLIGRSLKNNLLDKTFFSGLMDLIRGTEDVEKYGDNLVKRFAGSVVPAAVAGVARSTDPYLREVRTILDAIKTRIPILSQTVPPKLGAFGEPTKRPGTPIDRMISPFPISKEIYDPIYKEFTRLGLTITRPAISTSGKGVDKDASRRLAESAMPEVKKQALMVINSPFYRAIKNDEDKKKLLRAQMNKMRSFQRKLFILEETK